MALVGYLHQAKTGVVGDLGAMYNYVLAANGVFIQAENEHLWARLPVSGLTVPADWPHGIRGLLPLKPEVVLKHGLVPEWLWSQVQGLLATVGAEVYAAILWDEGKRRYRAVLPEQVGNAGSVKYSTVPGAIIEVHSHPPGMLFFSGTDDDDELGFRLYGVTARMPSLSLCPQNALASQWRCGIYGHFCPVPASKIFEGGEV